MKHDQSNKNRVSLSLRGPTGTDKKFLLPKYELQGFMHIQPPRNCPEYEKMSVAEISQRIHDDIDELVARVYPTYSEDWFARFAPARLPDIKLFRESSPYPSEELADRLRPGLYARLVSEDHETAKEAHSEWVELLHQFDVEMARKAEAEAQHATKALAFAAKEATTWLENLSVRRHDLIGQVAKDFPLWPVNIGLKRRAKASGDGRRSVQVVLARRKWVENYLKKIGVNASSREPDSTCTGAEPRSPFYFAAARVYGDLRLMKKSPEFHFQKMTRWAKRLIALSEPMTIKNKDEWWKVAKVWLDERWEKNCKEFAPLVACCSFWNKDVLKKVKFKVPLSEAPLFPSEVRRNIIDIRLREAFLQLAQPSDL